MSTTFLIHFNSITDPHIELCKKYELIDIFLLAISAVHSCVEGREDIDDFGHLKHDWFKHFNASIPRHDTIVRVIYR
jgi:hypothetical protein